MDTKPDAPADAGLLPHQCSPVSRNRRANFVFTLVGFCVASVVVLGVCSGLGIFAANIALVQVAMDGLNALALALSIAYITGSVVDYNGGISGVLGRRSPASAGYPARQASYDYAPGGYASTAQYYPPVSEPARPGEFFVDRHPDLRAGYSYDDPYRTASMQTAHNYPETESRG